MFAIYSNIEDISRDAGSVDIEEDILDSMFWIFIAFVFIILIMMLTGWSYFQKNYKWSFSYSVIQILQFTNPYMRWHR